MEYGTAIAPNAQGLGSDAGAYTAYIVNELLSFLQRSFRVSAEDQSVAFIGVSLGGLSAFDIAWHHRDRFGMAGVSPARFGGVLHQTKPSLRRTH